MPSLCDDVFVALGPGLRRDDENLRWTAMAFHPNSPIDARRSLAHNR
jgi:hypothetical protein